MSTEPTAEEFDCRTDLPRQIQEVAVALLFLLDQEAAGIEIVDTLTQFNIWFQRLHDSETTQDGEL